MPMELLRISLAPALFTTKVRLLSIPRRKKAIAFRRAVDAITFFCCSAPSNEQKARRKSSAGRAYSKRASSSYDEDQTNKSNAGKYISFLNVDSKNSKDVKRKIEEVIKSYKNLKKKSEFFIKDMVKNIKISGVVLTRDLESYLPCYNINYYIGKDSSAVTSGKRGSRNIIYIENKKYKLNQRFEKLIKIIINLKYLV